jgi:hypothetical protein
MAQVLPLYSASFFPALQRNFRRALVPSINKQSAVEWGCRSISWDSMMLSKTNIIHSYQLLDFIPSIIVFLKPSLVDFVLKI